MLTAESAVGKIVVFICQKSVGKLIQLPFDKRKKACRTLTKLYCCETKEKGERKGVGSILIGSRVLPPA